VTHFVITFNVAGVRSFRNINDVLMSKSQIFSHLEPRAAAAGGCSPLKAPPGRDLAAGEFL